MNNYSVYNDPKMYACDFIEKKELPSSTETVFAVREGEIINHTFSGFDDTSLEDIRTIIDNVDIAIVEEVARSKFLTSLHVYEYLKLRGIDVKRPRLRKRILKLMKLRLIQENEIIIPGAVRGIKYYELDIKGYLLAREAGIRFGIMETFKAETEHENLDGCIIRTAATVKIDAESVLAYEVVRDSADSLEKLADKIRRYYKMIHSRKYSEANYHGDDTVPQLVICGESLKHNRKIMKFLRGEGLWDEDDTILFTEDLLNMKDSLKSIYEITDREEIRWYQLPAKATKNETERSYA